MNTRDFAWRPVVVAVNAVQRVLIRHHSLYRLLFVDALEPFRWAISRHRAAYVARRAQQRFRPTATTIGRAGIPTSGPAHGIGHQSPTRSRSSSDTALRTAAGPALSRHVA